LAWRSRKRVFTVDSEREAEVGVERVALVAVGEGGAERVCVHPPYPNTSPDPGVPARGRGAVAEDASDVGEPPALLATPAELVES
jgi:hypothetical protein